MGKKNTNEQIDGVGRALCIDLCKKFGLRHNEKWYKQESDTVLENEEIKILRDFPIQIDKKISHNHTNIVMIKKKD